MCCSCRTSSLRASLLFFDCAGARLYLFQSDAERQPESILYFSVADIRRAYDALSQRGAEFINAPHLIHRHADGTEEWMAFFKDLEGRPLAIMSRVKMSIVPVEAHGSQ